MKFNHQRGNTHGIKQYQSDVRQRARTALQQALQILALEFPLSQWNNIQICRKAGLASSAALKKPWNADLLELVRNHNEKIREKIFIETSLNKAEAQHIPPKVKHPTSKIIKKLRSELVLRDAELLALEKENSALRQQLHRTSNNLARKN